MPSYSGDQVQKNPRIMAEDLQKSLGLVVHVPAVRKLISNGINTKTMKKTTNLQKYSCMSRVDKTPPKQVMQKKVIAQIHLL